MMNLFSRLLCVVGIHDAKFSKPFERKCDCCGAKFRADYADWHKHGGPRWVRVTRRAYRTNLLKDHHANET